MSIMPEGGWGFQTPQGLQQNQDSNQRDEDAHQTHIAKPSHLKADRTTKAILLVIALLLMVIAVKVYVFPNATARDTSTNLHEAQQSNQSSQQTSLAESGVRAATTQPRDACPTRSEAERAMNEHLASMNDSVISIRSDDKVHDLQCRNIGGNTCDCQVLWDYRTDNSAFNESGKTGTVRFSKLGGKWRE
jgi:cytoskeletal protein RodZ